MLFRDRVDAGRRLGEHLRALGYGGREIVVLGLPRGGVPVACEVARELRSPVDVILVRKIGVPFQPELAMGALGEGGVRIIDRRILEIADVDTREFSAVETRERTELGRRAALFRGNRERVRLAGRVALIVDDGIATGSTVRAACGVARAQGAARVVVATPVAPPETVAALRSDADDVVALHTPAEFFAIGNYYADFTATSDDEVVRLLASTSNTPQPHSDDVTPT